jgi:hypothetical protein
MTIIDAMDHAENLLNAALEERHERAKQGFFGPKTKYSIFYGTDGKVLAADTMTELKTRIIKCVPGGMKNITRIAQQIPTMRVDSIGCKIHSLELRDVPLEIFA